MCNFKLPAFTTLIILQIIFSITLHAQDSTNIHIDNTKFEHTQIYAIPIELQLSPDFYKFEIQKNHAPLTFRPYTKEKKAIKKNIQFSYTGNKSTADYLGLGSFEQFNNQFTIQYKNSLSLNTNISLQKHEFFTNQNFSDYTMGFTSSLEYAITDRISAYIYWQISKPLNKPQIEYNTFNNLSKTIFLNNEIGCGIKAQFKNFRINVGVNATYNSEFNTTKKINTLNTQISLEL